MSGPAGLPSPPPPPALAAVLLGCVLLLSASTPSAPAMEEPDIRPPRPAVELPEPPLSKTALTAGTLGTLAAAALAWLAWKKWTAQKPAPPLAPLEQARESLRLIHAGRDTLGSPLLADRTADVIRTFLAARFGIAAPRRTTGELLRLMEQNPGHPLWARRKDLAGLLQTCDRAKFAGAGFDAVERFALLEEAARFVQAADLLAQAANPLQDAPAAETEAALESPDAALPVPSGPALPGPSAAKPETPPPALVP